MNSIEKVFLEELLGVVSAVEENNGEINLNKKLNGVCEVYHQIENKDEIWNILDDMCGDIPQTYYILLLFLNAAIDEEEITVKQLNVLTNGVNHGDIDLFYAIFHKWQITRKIFMSPDRKSLYVERNILHKELIQSMKRFLQVDFPVIEKNQRNSDRIVVVITLLLGIKHGPTRNAFDYCHTLQTKLNKEIFLLVAAEMPSRKSHGYETYGLDYLYSNYEESYEGGFTFEYLGEKIRGYQCIIDQDHKDEIKNILNSVYEWKPALIYNIGSENIIADILGSFTTEVTVPCANDYPISAGEFLILTRNIEERDKEIVDYINENKQTIIESIFVYKLEEPIKKYSKAEFDIDEDAFVVAVVGTRLGLEIHEDFLQILKDVLLADSAINVVFIGNDSDFEQHQEIIGYKDRVQYLGHQNDLRGVYNIADIYLNPPRKGGGTSAAEALAEGVPVISLAHCDVAYTSGNSFLCESLQDMPEIVMRYKNDKEFYLSQSKKAKIQAKAVSDTEEVLRGILNQISHA